jgi:Heterokaryon incompatibility protein (HET)
LHASIPRLLPKSSVLYEWNNLDTRRPVTALQFTRSCWSLNSEEIFLNQGHTAELGQMDEQGTTEYLNEYHNTYNVAATGILEPLKDIKRNFRLVRIRPGSRGDPLECLIVMGAEEGLYSALSYEWGDLDHESILLNGRTIKIRKNLLLFLYELRARTVQENLYFIDAICIDQSNLVERNAQVRLMRKIYANAERVCVWLGPHADGSERALSIWSKFGPVEVPFILPDDSARLYTALYTHILQEINRTYGNFDNGLFWKETCAITERSYWSRLWIVQEVILAERLLIFCGNSTLVGTMYANFHPFSSILESGSRSTASTRMFNIAGVYVNPSQLGARFQGIISRWTDRKKSTNTSKSTLSQLIEQFGDNKCSDLRDRIYGLLGLLGQASDQSETQMPPVDYSMPLEMLHFEVLKFCKATEALRFDNASNIRDFSIRLTNVLGLDRRYEIEGK